MRFEMKPVKSKRVWHKKFAFFPRQIGNKIVWLEFYERILIDYASHADLETYDYRLL